MMRVVRGVRPDAMGYHSAFGCESHAGRVRDNNQDAAKSAADLGLWIVADGMGGEAAGEVASRLAVDEIETAIRSGDPLPDAVARAHRSIRAAPARGFGSAGMGSTVVVLKLHSHRYEIAWVGDSRVYLLRRGVLTQLTRDHSLVQDLLESGAISVIEAQAHPHRNIITRVLGGDAEPVIDQCSGRVDAGDLFLLCSDGLNNEIDDARIRDLLTAAKGPEAAAADLVAAAVEAGGRDNISAMVVAVD